ncbi:MAG: sugar transferase, partial [Synergistes sp.]|nr:sugar transferase [Synergistes sp.]
MEHKAGFYEKYVKRGFDFICALMILLCFSWLYIIVAVLVRIKLGTPIFFRQKRPGLGCQIFEMYKFRTMTDDRDTDGNLLPDDKRLTPFGAALRSSSIDEIPEIFNILRGEMSFVGPRPLLVKYLPRYNDRQIH